jgi:hypothetical protein
MRTDREEGADESFPVAYKRPASFKAGMSEAQPEAAAVTVQMNKIHIDFFI